MTVRLARDAGNDSCYAEGGAVRLGKHAQKIEIRRAANLPDNLLRRHSERDPAKLGVEER